MGLLTVAFWRDFREYWTIIEHFEVGNTPNGLSLQHFLPRLWARGAPALLTLAVAAVMLVGIRSARERHRIFTSVSLPFALALVNVALCFGTLSFEYHTLSLLGVIPGLVIWVEREPWVSYRAKAFTATLFGLFLLMAFRVFGPSQETFGPLAMTLTYLCFASLFFGQCVYLVVVLVRPSAAWPAPRPPEPG